MRYVLSGFLALLGILDFVLFVQYATQQEGVLEFLTYHGIIAMVSILVLLGIPFRYRIWPYYLLVLLPGFGPLGYGLVQFFVIYYEYNQMLLFEYEKYIQFERLFDIGSDSTFASDVKVMSYQDQLLFSQHQTKKDMITSMLSDTQADYTYLLKQSLDDEDMEVTHYAATALNAFEQQFEQDIASARIAYTETQSVTKLLVLLEKIEDYLASRLMDPAVKKVFLEDYIELLERLIKADGESADLAFKVMNAHVDLDRLEEADRQAAAFIDRYPNDVRGYTTHINVLFHQRRWTEIVNYIDFIRDKYPTLPKELEGLSHFWGKEV